VGAVAAQGAALGARQGQLTRLPEADHALQAVEKTDQAGHDERAHDRIHAPSGKLGLGGVANGAEALGQGG